MTSIRKVYDGQFWRPFAGMPYQDPFVLRVTKPGPTNTGLAVNNIDEASLVPVAGNLTITTGGTVENPRVVSGYNVQGVIVVQNGVSNLIIENNLIRFNGTSSTYRVAVQVFGASSTNVVVRYNTVRVATADRSYLRAYGIQGSGVHSLRNDISGTVDGVSTTVIGKRSYAYVEGNYIHDLPYNSYDAAHTDGTHNDAVQVEGLNTEVRLIGNYFRTGHSSAVLITQDAGTYDTQPVVEDNWFDIEDTTTGSLLNVKTNVTIGIVAKRNRFTKSTPAKPRIILYPTQLNASIIDATGDDRNVFDDGSADVVPVYNGTSQLYSY